MFSVYPFDISKFKDTYIHILSDKVQMTAAPRCGQSYKCICSVKKYNG